MRAVLLNWLQTDRTTTAQLCTYCAHVQFNSNKAASYFAALLHVCSWLPYDSIPLLSFAVILHVCSLLSYNSIVLLLFAGDLHVYRYESYSYCLICLQTAHMQFVAFCIHACVYNMKLPIRSSSTCNSKIAPKLLLLKICWMLARK